MSGFDYKRFVDESAAKEYQCLICFNVVSDAVDTDCEHMFCYQCLNEWVFGSSDRKYCPYCMKSLIETNSADDSVVVSIDDNRILANRKPEVNTIVGQLIIKCEYHSYGCQEVCPLVSMPTHVDTCQYEMCSECGLSKAGRTAGGHNCLDAMTRDRNKWRDLCNELTAKLDEPSPQIASPNAMVSTGAFRLTVDRLNVTEVSVELTGIRGPNAEAGQPLDSLVIVFCQLQELMVYLGSALTLLCLRPKPLNAIDVFNRLSHYGPKDYISDDSKDPMERMIVILIRDTIPETLTNLLLQWFNAMSVGGSGSVIAKESADKLLDEYYG